MERAQKWRGERAPIYGDVTLKTDADGLARWARAILRRSHDRSTVKRFDNGLKPRSFVFQDSSSSSDCIETHSPLERPSIYQSPSILFPSRLSNPYLEPRLSLPFPTTHHPSSPSMIKTRLDTLIAASIMSRLAYLQPVDQAARILVIVHRPQVPEHLLQLVSFVINVLDRHIARLAAAELANRLTGTGKQELDIVPSVLGTAWKVDADEVGKCPEELPHLDLVLVELWESGNNAQELFEEQVFGFGLAEFILDEPAEPCYISLAGGRKVGLKEDALNGNVFGVTLEIWNLPSLILGLSSSGS